MDSQLTSAKTIDKLSNLIYVGCVVTKITRQNFVKSRYGVYYYHGYAQEEPFISYN